MALIPRTPGSLQKEGLLAALLQIALAAESLHFQWKFDTEDL